MRIQTNIRGGYMITDKRITKEEFDSIKHLEDRFKQALVDYIRMVTTKDFQIVEAIYERVFRDTQYKNGSCGHCVLKVFKSIAPLYFEFKETLDTKMIKDTTEEQKVAVEPNKVAKKRGRPSKLKEE